MKKIIETLEIAIPFLASYPVWVKSLVALWILFTAILIVILLFSSSKEKDSTILPPKELHTQQIATGNNNTQIGIDGDNNSISIKSGESVPLLEPIVEVDFEIDNFAKKYIFRILNDGHIPIYEIHIETYSLLFNATIGKNTTSMRPRQEWNLIKDQKRPSDWQFIKKLDPTNKIIFDIPYNDLNNTYMAIPVHAAITKNDLIAIQFYYITYRRKPDRKYYSLRKYLYVNKDKENNILVVQDLDKAEFEDFVELKKYYESYNKDRLK